MRQTYHHDETEVSSRRYVCLIAMIIPHNAYCLLTDAVQNRGQRRLLSAHKRKGAKGSGQPSSLHSFLSGHREPIEKSRQVVVPTYRLHAEKAVARRIPSDSRPTSS